MDLLRERSTRSAWIEQDCGQHADASRAALQPASPPGMRSRATGALDSRRGKKNAIIIVVIIIVVIVVIVIVIIIVIV